MLRCYVSGFRHAMEEIALVRQHDRSAPSWRPGNGRSSGGLAAVGDPSAEGLLGPDDGHRRAALVHTLLARAVGTGELPARVTALTWRTVDLFLGADPRAEPTLAELGTLLRRDPSTPERALVEALQVMLLIRGGRLEEAACARGRSAGHSGAPGRVMDAPAWAFDHRVAIRWYEGDGVRLASLADDAAPAPGSEGTAGRAFVAAALAAVACGDRDRASLALDRVGDGDLLAVPRSGSWLVTVYGAVEAALMLGRADIARTAYALLLAYAQRPMMLDAATVCFGSTEHALGLAALAMGRREAAVRHLRAAIAANTGLGHLPALLHSRARLAQALTAGADPREQDEGIRLRRTAEAEAIGNSWALPRGELALRDRRPLALVADPPALVLQRHGSRWTLRWGSRTVRTAHGVGMVYLAVLLANPGREIAAAHLAAGHAHDPDVQVDSARAGRQRTLDDEARRSYRRRLQHLDGELRLARDRPDRTRVEALQREHDRVAAELRAAQGIGGRDRMFAGNAERARISVGKAIRRAVTRLHEADADLGQYLRDTVQTGVRCCYRPPLTARLPGVAHR
jgi:hypothetical protein